MDHSSHHLECEVVTQEMVVDSSKEVPEASELAILQATVPSELTELEVVRLQFQFHPALESAGEARYWPGYLSLVQKQQPGFLPLSEEFALCWFAILLSVDSNSETSASQSLCC